MKEIQLTKGYVALVDDDDYDRLSKFKWAAYTKRGCVYACRTVFMHGEIMGPTPPDKKIVDHIDRNGLNNTKDNLRFASYTENARNSRRGDDAAYTFRGVRGEKFYAAIRYNNRRYYLGSFKTQEEATMAARARMKLLEDAKPGEVVEITL